MDGTAEAVPFRFGCLGGSGSHFRAIAHSPATQLRVSGAPVVVRNHEWATRREASGSATRLLFITF